MVLDTLGEAVTATVSAVLGDRTGLFAQRGALFGATLTIDADARVPDGTTLLRPGSRDALVRLAPLTDLNVPRTVSIKVPDAYGEGQDQDFLLASSGNGAPLHHAVLPSTGFGHLYSSLWLYLAGLEPVAFGARVYTGDTELPGAGDRIEFLLSGVLSRFRQVGTLELGDEIVGQQLDFAAAHTGGGLRALPPASFYRG